MEIQAKISALMENEAFRNAFENAGNARAVVDLFGANGVEVPLEIAQELFDRNEEELSVEDLDNVAGGGGPLPFLPRLRKNTAAMKKGRTCFQVRPCVYLVKGSKRISSDFEENRMRSPGFRAVSAKGDSFWPETQVPLEEAKSVKNQVPCRQVKVAWLRER